MGGRFSRRIEVLSPETNSNHQYNYPLPEGRQYFSSHYHLGTRKFETSDPEHFLFGELPDINYMSSPPAAFPYKQPPRKKPVECLNSFINLHKESVKLVRHPDDSSMYTIEFLFDSDVPCRISVFFSLLDISSMAALKHGTTTSAVTKVSQCFMYEKGLEQSFSQPSVSLKPSNWMEDRLVYSPDTGQNLFPVSILLETRSLDEEGYQSLLTICKLEQSSVNSDSYTIKVLKQKLMVDTMEYLLHDIFGIENKALPKEENEEGEENNDDHSSLSSEDDLGAECVICYTDVRDTVLLPCRHLCICASCAADLRYQASNCPICRSPFQALLQIQALQVIPSNERPDDDEITDNPEIYSVPGYKTMSLMQAINGYPKIKHTKTTHSTTEPPLSTEEEGEEEDDMNTNDTPISGQQQEPPVTTDTVIMLEEDSNHTVVTTADYTSTNDLAPPSSSNTVNHGDDKVENNDELKEDGNRQSTITVSASIESGNNSPSSYQLRRKSSLSTGMSGSWDSSSKSNSVDSFTSHDVLLK